MNSTFPRVLTLLRKERGISQKEAAASLKISQALLSHYEKGIRECGLEFVVRVADFYDVSCDYLLGRTADKAGARIAVDDIPMKGSEQEADSALPVLNKKLTLNSVTVLFDLLQRYNNNELTSEVAAYLSLAVYTVFRQLYAANPRNPEALFAISAHLYSPAAAGAMGVSAAKIGQLARALNSEEGAKGKRRRSLAPDDLSKTYPLFASSLLNLLKNAEGQLESSFSV